MRPLTTPPLSTLVVTSPMATALALCSAAPRMKLVNRNCWALVLRSPGMQGRPRGSESQPMVVRPEPSPELTSSGAGRVRTVPSSKTKVIELTWPRTQESVQSPVAVPLTMALSTSGRVMPLAVRFSRPITTLNG